MNWLLLIDAPHDGAWNMALDEALMEAAEAEGLKSLRLYAWDPPTLSFGRNEPALRRYDRAAIAARGLATVRRPTGGRAVWHHREVTYSVAAPADTFGALRDTYREIHAMLAAGAVSLWAAGAGAPRAPPGAARDAGEGGGRPPPRRGGAGRGAAPPRPARRAPPPASRGSRGTCRAARRRCRPARRRCR